MASPDLKKEAATLLPTARVVADLQHWLAEDGLEQGDVTSESILTSSDQVEASLVARQPMVACGLEPLSRALATPPLAGRLQLTTVVPEGATVLPGEALGRLSGGRRSMLAAERTLLNVLGRLSGVASTTRRFVKAIEGTGAVITDTRKTMPGLRIWDKYAVLVGGGTLHRLGLHDAALFKDNHLAGIPEDQLAGRLAEACRTARERPGLKFVEVEVDTLSQLDVVLSLDDGLVDIVLLDNMEPATLREAVSRRDLSRRPIALEASGGIELDVAFQVASTGVDRIAIGALTRLATVMDIGLDL